MEKTMIKLIVDCFGGDHSPDANIDGALEALSVYDDLYIILSGDEEIIKSKLSEREYDKERIEILNAPEVVGCDEKPTDAIRLKRESSMMKAIKLLRENDDIAGMVSTGSSGALVAAATLRVGRLRKVIRPAFCPVIPTMAGSVVGICDSGANVDITPEHLLQYAIMANHYMENVYEINNPRIALLNIGTEEEKGDELHKRAYELLSGCKEINFVGNMESRDLLSGNYDLIVCDGFSGNVLIKTTEGTSLEILKRLKKDIYSKLKYKIGALFMRKMFMDEKEFMNYQNYGGSVLLGCSKIIVKGHGSAKARSVEKSIEQAYKMQKHNINEKIEESIEKAFSQE